MAKRRTNQPKKLRDRREGSSAEGRSPYAKYNKVPYRYGKGKGEGDK